MKTKLLKKLRNRGRGQITIYSITKSGKTTVGMEYGHDGTGLYRDLFCFGDTEEDVLKKAETIYINEYLKNKIKRIPQGGGTI